MDRSGSWCNGSALVMSIMVMVMVMLSLLACGCTCLTIKISDNSEALSSEEANTVFIALHSNDFVSNATVGPSNTYYRGRIFSKYMNVSGKGVVLRFTRWSSECSISMSKADTTKGSELLEAFRLLVPSIAAYALQGYEWVAVSNHTYWIDYFVRPRYEFLNSPLQSLSHVQVHRGGDTGSSFRPARILSSSRSSFSSSSSTDCGIKPHMLLSHYAGYAFNNLYPGENLISPSGKFALSLEDNCNAVLLDVEQNTVLWSTNTNVEENQNCFLRLHTEGSLDLRNGGVAIWTSETACSPYIECSGTTSLAMEDTGKFTIFRSVDDHLAAVTSFP